VSVFRGLDLHIDSGEFVSIMGPTGVGKSTLCLTLNGIVPHSTGGVFRGDVIVEGLNTKETGVATLASQVGIVFQDPESQFFNMTVEDEVAFGPESLGVEPAVIAERIEWALDIVGMQAYRRRSPFHLSGGQKQRVAIASILAMKPRILVLDEPTSGLDPVGKADVFRVVRELKRQQGMTIIMVEQEAETIAEFSERLIVLWDGNVAMDGTPREVFAQVTALEGCGLAIPQVSQLAHLHNGQWGTDYDFIRLDEAYAVLAEQLKAADQKRSQRG
jgi:energy-coupling factor transporter ATP-binding protein EcfA2